MSQQLLDLINRVGGADAVASMAARVGLSPEQTQSAMAALVPSVAGGLQRHAETVGADQVDAVSASAAALATPAAIGSGEAISHGEALADQLFGGAGGAAAVVAKAAQATGLDPSILAQLLPMVTTLTAGTLASPATGAQGTMGTLMGMLDINKDGNPLDDIAGFAGKLFGR